MHQEVSKENKYRQDHIKVFLYQDNDKNSIIIETLLCFWMYNCKSRYVGYMQFTNADWDWIIQKRKERKKKEKKRKEKKPNCIKSGLSQFLFLQQKM